MPKLRADRKNYKKAFDTHFHSYITWNNGCLNTKRLIIFYCVETGLKCLIMKDHRIERISQANTEIAHVLGTHDLKRLLKEVKKAGVYRFQNFQSEYNDTINSENYHQLCRYCIDTKDTKAAEDFEKTLHNIAEWLKEVI